MADKVKDISLVSLFTLLFAACGFFVLVGFLMQSWPLVIWSFIFAGIFLFLLLLIMLIEEVRIRIKS